MKVNVGNNFLNVWRCIAKILASVWENVLILTPYLDILIINFIELFEKISLELSVLVILKI